MASPVRASRGEPGTVTRMIDFLTTIDVRQVLPTITTPTLVLHHAGDRLYLSGHGRYLAEHIDGTRYVELPGSDHLWLGEDSDTLLEEIQEFLTGVRAPSQPDRVLTTILFTDMVGSTELAASLGGERWRELLDRHDAVVRHQLERARGREIGTSGDGFVASFDGPARAIRCTVTISEAMRPLGLQVRAGLHSGECEVRGNDLGGLAVHIAARVAEAAQRGRGARLEHRQGPCRRIRDRLRRPRTAPAQGRSRRMATVRNHHHLALANASNPWSTTATPQHITADLRSTSHTEHAHRTSLQRAPERHVCARGAGRTDRRFGARSESGVARFWRVVMCVLDPCFGRTGRPRVKSRFPAGLTLPRSRCPRLRRRVRGHRSAGGREPLREPWGFGSGVL